MSKYTNTQTGFRDVNQALSTLIQDKHHKEEMDFAFLQLKTQEKARLNEHLDRLELDYSRDLLGTQDALDRLKFESMKLGVNFEEKVDSPTPDGKKMLGKIFDNLTNQYQDAETNIERIKGELKNISLVRKVMMSQINSQLPSMVQEDRKLAQETQRIANKYTKALTDQAISYAEWNRRRRQATPFSQVQRMTSFTPDDVLAEAGLASNPASSFQAVLNNATMFSQTDPGDWEKRHNHPLKDEIAKGLSSAKNLAGIEDARYNVAKGIITWLADDKIDFNFAKYAENNNLGFDGSDVESLVNNVRNGSISTLDKDERKMLDVLMQRLAFANTDKLHDVSNPNDVNNDKEKDAFSSFKSGMGIWMGLYNTSLDLDKLKVHLELPKDKKMTDKEVNDSLGQEFKKRVYEEYYKNSGMEELGYPAGQ